MAKLSAQRIEDDQAKLVASEVNLARLPFFASSVTKLKAKKKVEYRRTIEQAGQEVEVLWKVTANAEYGYPGPQAEAVHVAILKIMTEGGFPVQNPVRFTLYELCHRLGIRYNTKSRRQLRQTIFSTRFAGIEIKNSFLRKDGRRPTFTDTQNLYKRVVFFGETNPETGDEVELSAVWLADFYLDSINGGYVRPLDFDRYKFLYDRSFAATKIYNYLGYRFAGTFRHGNDYARVDYDELAVIVDVQRQTYRSKAEERLATAHRALLESGFVERVEWQEGKEKGEKPRKIDLLYYPGPAARQEYHQSRAFFSNQLSLLLEEGEGLKDEVKTPASELEHELVSLGVTSKRARRIVSRFTPELITKQLDHLAHLSEQGQPPSNAPGWLVRAIEDDYAPPKGFTSREEREEQERAAQEAKVQAEREAAIRAQAEQERHEAHAATYEAIDERLAVLPAGKQDHLRATAAERVQSDFDPFFRNFYTTREFDPNNVMHREDYYRHLSELLEGQ